MLSLQEVVRTGDYDAVHAYITSLNLNNPDFLLSWELRDAMTAAAEKGCARIVRLLLRYITPFIFAMQTAVDHGHTEVVEVLLDDGRVEEHVDLYIPVYHGFTQMVQLILQQYGQQRTQSIPRLCNVAIRQGHTDIALLLLQDAHITADDLRGMWTSAIIRGHDQIMQRLLKEEVTIDLMEHGIRLAAGATHHRVLEMLLACPIAADVSVKDINKAACHTQVMENIRLLSQHCHFDVSFDRFNVIRQGSHAIVTWLLHNSGVVIPPIILLQRVYVDDELLHEVLLSSYRSKFVAYLRYNERFLLPSDVMLRQAVRRDDVNEWIRSHLTDAPPGVNRWIPHGGPGFWDRMAELDDLNRLLI